MIAQFLDKKDRCQLNIGEVSNLDSENHVPIWITDTDFFEEIFPICELEKEELRQLIDFLETRYNKMA